MDKVLVVGAGGHAKVIVDILQRNGNYEVAGLAAPEGSQGFWNLPVLGCDEKLAEIYAGGQIPYAFVALGDGALRQKVAEKVKKAGFRLINVISREAVLSARVSLGEGIAVMPGAVINADVRLNDGCIVNTNASVDHESVVGEYTHIAPGCAVCGGVTIGKRCLLGVGSSVIDHVRIGDDTIVGAGAAVVSDICGNVTVKGVPARG